MLLLHTASKESGSAIYKATSQLGRTADWGGSTSCPSTLQFRGLCDLCSGHCCGSIVSTAFQLPRWETPAGKSRAPPCKHHCWFTHKQKTVTDTENAVVIHALPKQTQTFTLRNGRFFGVSIKITCLKLMSIHKSSEITDFKFLR